MMRFRIITQRRPDRLNVTVEGDVLYVNDEALDFGFLEEGDYLPSDAAESQWVGPGGVERIDGEIVLTLIVPYGRNAPDALIDPPSEVVWGEDWSQLPPYGDALETSEQIDAELDRAANG